MLLVSKYGEIKALSTQNLNKYCHNLYGAVQRGVCKFHLELDLWYRVHYYLMLLSKHLLKQLHPHRQS